jgi:hypothetical protein
MQIDPAGCGKTPDVSSAQGGKREMRGEGFCKSSFEHLRSGAATDHDLVRSRGDMED